MDSSHVKRPPLIILLFLVSFAAVSAVLFTPALPQIQNFFNLSTEATQLTITLYLVGYALGQLPYGPIANAFGRKKALYVGLLISILGSIFCMISYYVHSVSLLFVGRFLQAIGASAGLKITYTMVADVFSQTEATRIISRIIMAFAIMPGISIAIGGYLTEFFGWISCFYFLLILGIAIFLLSLRLKETASSLDINAITPSLIYRGYLKKFKNRRLIFSALIMGSCSATVYVFAMKAPFIGISLIGLTPSTFGALNLLPSIGMLIGSYFAGSMAGQVPLMRILKACVTGFLIMSLLMFVAFILKAPSIYTLFLPMIAIYIFQSIILANIGAFGLHSAHNKANASAILNFVGITLIVIAVIITEFVYPESALFLPIAFLFIATFMAIIICKIKKHTC